MSGETLHVRHEAGVEMIIAIDSTARGPALGGCRWRPYSNSQAARDEAQALAQAMTRKAAMARLPLGGGKAVVVGDPAQRTSAHLHAFGSFVESLGGRYFTGADMGTGEDAMATIAETTRYATGLPVDQGGAGDPGPWTALGVHMAIDRALARVHRSLRGARVCIQGAGSVGGRLARHLLESGATVVASDVNDAALKALPESITRLSAEQILEEPCDVFAPCGPGGVIDRKLAADLECAVVCGAANNPLCDAETAQVLQQRGILYVPDFVANAGGLIHLGLALGGGDAEATRAYLSVIPENLECVLDSAERWSCDPAAAAERLALERVSSPASCE